MKRFLERGLPSRGRRPVKISLVYGMEGNIRTLHRRSLRPRGRNLYGSAVGYGLDSFGDGEPAVARLVCRLAFFHSWTASAVTGA